MVEAEKYFKRAETLGLNMDADMAMTKLNLAGIAMTKNRKRDDETANEKNGAAKTTIWRRSWKRRKTLLNPHKQTNYF